MRIHDRCLRLVVLGILASPVAAAMQHLQEMDLDLRTGLSGCVEPFQYARIVTRKPGLAHRLSPCEPEPERLVWGTASVVNEPTT